MEMFWWDADEGDVNTLLIPYVQTVDHAECDHFERFLRLACLYDPNERMGISSSLDWRGPEYAVTENVCASNVDTVSALISRSDITIRFVPDDGDWSASRRAKHLEWYTDSLRKEFGVEPMERRAFKDSSIFGTGLMKVTLDGPEGAQFIVVERVLVDEVIVDTAECRVGKKPRQMHQRRFVDVQNLMATFPKLAKDIEFQAGRGLSDTHAMRLWANYRPIERTEVAVIESWRLPYGKKGSKHYRPGRHVIVMEGLDLLDEEWEYEFFPFAKLSWNERTTGWYDRGLVEDIAGLQKALNKLNWQIDRAIDHYAVPITFVRPSDADLKVKTINRVGSVCVVRGDYPETVVPQAVGGEAFGQRDYIKNSASEFGGVSRMSQHGVKPVGLESAPALREYKDITNERFAIQEKAYEEFRLQVAFLLLHWCKVLGAQAPKYSRTTRFGKRTFEWVDVDLKDVRYQMQAANPLAKTLAGRTATVTEWMNSGVITQEEGRRLLKHPDIERAISLYTAALEDIERTIEEVLEGEVVFPEPFQNLKMGVWRFQQAYLTAKGDGAPEEVLDDMSTWIEQAAWILMQQEKAEQGLKDSHEALPPIPGMPGMDPMMGGPPPPGGMGMGGPPMMPPPPGAPPPPPPGGPPGGGMMPPPGMPPGAPPPPPM